MTFWSELQGSKHPADEEILRQHQGQHTLELRYPPPAFVGDVLNARVFILYANGGFDEEDTGQEFKNLITEDAYRERLRKPVPCDDQTHPYWLASKRMAPWLRAGKAAVVNAMAYRSRKISEERQNQRIADKLPSVAFHRDWLRGRLLPAAEAGRIMVHVHRWNLWGLKDGEASSRCVQYSKNPGFKYMSDRSADAVQKFLAVDPEH